MRACDPFIEVGGTWSALVVGIGIDIAAAVHRQALKLGLVKQGSQAGGDIGTASLGYGDRLSGNGQLAGAGWPAVGVHFETHD